MKEKLIFFLHMKHAKSFLSIKMDDTSPLPPIVQKHGQNNLDTSTAILHWWCHSWARVCTVLIRRWSPGINFPDSFSIRWSQACCWPCYESVYRITTWTKHTNHRLCKNTHASQLYESLQWTLTERQEAQNTNCTKGQKVNPQWIVLPDNI